MTLDAEIRHTKKDDWRGNPIKRREVLLVIRQFMSGAGEAERVFELVSNQDEY